MLIGMTGWIVKSQHRDTGKLDAIAEQQKSDHALLGQFIKANGGDASLTIGKGGESAYNKALRTIADENKITVVEARQRLTAAATAIQQDPAATFFDRAKAAFALKDFDKAYDLSIEAAEKQSADLAEKWMLAGGAAYEQVKYLKATDAFEKALALRDKTKDPLVWAYTAIWLGRVYDDLAAYAKAEPLLREVASFRETNLGPEDPDLANAINNLAGLLVHTNRMDEAEPMYRRALAMDEKSFGPEHPRVAADLNILAGLLDDTNRQLEAVLLNRRALAIDEKSFGPDHPDVARDINNLAVVLLKTNRRAEAEQLSRRALRIVEKTFGADHPNVASVLNNLALLLNETNRQAEAEPIYRRALAINEKSFGPEHPNVAVELSNLALTLQDTNRKAEAESLDRRALTIDEKVFGPDHPIVAIRVHNLAFLLASMNPQADAEPMYRRSILILAEFQKQTGHEHPGFQKMRGNYESALKKLGKTEAEIAAAVGEITSGN